MIENIQATCALHTPCFPSSLLSPLSGFLCSFLCSRSLLAAAAADDVPVTTRCCPITEVMPGLHPLPATWHLLRFMLEEC